MRLAIELYGTRIGTLDSDARVFGFTPDDAAIERFGTNSPVLSVAIPLTPSQRTRGCMTRFGRSSPTCRPGARWAPLRRRCDLLQASGCCSAASESS